MSSIPNSPSSSSSSSPFLDAVDSSPPLSPELAPILTSEVSPTPSHPFAASTKAIKHPYQHERQGTKRRRPNGWGSRISSNADIEPVCKDAIPRHRPSGSADVGKVVDPFSASAKGIWFPPIHEKKIRTHSRTVSSVSAAEDVFPAPAGALQDVFVFMPPPAPTLTHAEDDALLSDVSLQSTPLAPRTRRLSLSTEQQQWECAISNAIAEANGFIDLSASGVLGNVFTHIPPVVGDLASLVLLRTDNEESPLLSVSRRAVTPEPNNEVGRVRKRVFARSVTVPTGPQSHSILDYTLPMSSKARSSPHVTLFNVPRRTSKPTGVQLILEKHAISSLPIELFSVASLTVLNLRSNRLEVLPPQIAQLANLRELNLKNNRLSYLPAEMLEMRLDVLELDLNPWIQPEQVALTSDSNRPVAKSTDHEVNDVVDLGSSSQSPGPLGNTSLGWAQLPRPLSDTRMHFSVASLGEVCLRVLLSPYAQSLPSQHSSTQSSGPSECATSPVSLKQSPPWPHHETNLHAYHDLPLSNDKYPPHCLSTLRACLPSAVARPAPNTLLESDTTSPRAGVKTAETASHDIFSVSPGSSSDPRPCTPPHYSASASRPRDVGNFREDAYEGCNVGFGICPSRAHFPLNSRIFTRHAEERFSWENIIAGVSVGEEKRVPVLWRGCSPGCLRFLDPEDEDGGSDDSGGKIEVQEAQPMDLDDGMVEAQSENGAGVEEMDLSGGLDDFDCM